MTHQLNEKRRRLESLKTECAFCGEECTNRKKHVYIPLFRLSEKPSLILDRSVRFKKIEIGISRCSKCKAKHQSFALKSNFISFITALSICVFSILIWEIKGLLSLFPAMFIGFLGSLILKDILIKYSGFKTELEVASQEPIVNEFIQNGWSLEHPTK